MSELTDAVRKRISSHMTDWELGANTGRETIDAIARDLTPLIEAAEAMRYLVSQHDIDPSRVTDYDAARAALVKDKT